MILRPGVSVAGLTRTDAPLLVRADPAILLEYRPWRSVSHKPTGGTVNLGRDARATHQLTGARSTCGEKATARRRWAQSVPELAQDVKWFPTKGLRPMRPPGRDDNPSTGPGSSRFCPCVWTPKMFRVSALARRACREAAFPTPAGFARELDEFTTERNGKPKQPFQIPA